MGKIYVNDIGTEIILNCGVDISTATVKQIKVIKPNGKAVSWTATLEGTTAIKYVTLTGDLDQIGTYKVQSYVEIPSWKGRGETSTFIVYGVFE